MGKLDSDLCVWQTSWRYELSEPHFFIWKKLSCSCQSQEFHTQDVSGTIPKNSQVILRNTWIDETPKPPAHLSLNTLLVLHPMNTQGYGVWKIPCVLSIADLPVLTAINGCMSNILYRIDTELPKHRRLLWINGHTPKGLWFLAPMLCWKVEVICTPSSFLGL